MLNENLDESCTIEDKWLVVLFVEEGTVEVVPKKWHIASSNKSYWPGEIVGTKVLLDSIKKCISPRANWTTHNVKVLGEYDDFKKASQKVVKAKTSDILTTTDSSNGIPKKRRRIKKKLIYNSSSDTPATSSEDDDFPKPPTKRTSNNLTQKNTSTNPHLIDPGSNDTHINTKQNKENTPSCSRSTVHDKDALHNSKEAEFHKTVLKILHTIDYKMNNMQSDLNILLKANNKVHIEETGTIQKDNTILNIFKLMPFTKKEHVEQIENLSDVQVQLLAQELSLIGGQTTKESTKTLMYRLFSNKLGSCYTWEGMKQKHCFKTLKIAQVIIKAVRLNPKTANSSELDVVQNIKSWLLRARERLLNSEKKKTRETTEETNEVTEV